MSTCPEHNKELRTNSNGAYCPTPIRKDGNGNVLEWCQYGKSQTGTSVPQNSNRYELISKVLTNMSLKLDKLAEGQKLLSEMLESIGGRELPKQNPNQTKVPF